MESSPRRNPLRRALIGALLGAPLGLAGGFVVARAVKRGMIAPLEAWTGADLFSLAIALGLVVSAGYAGWAATSGRRWNQMVERLSPDEPVDPAALVSGRRQALVAGLAGAMMILPPVAAHAGLGDGARTLVAGVVALLLAVQTLANWRLWRDGDELTRAVIAQSGAACFWLLQLALFVWATLTRLDLAPEADAWTLMTVMMGVYLLIGTIISARRGLVA